MAIMEEKVRIMGRDAKAAGVSSSTGVDNPPMRDLSTPAAAKPGSMVCMTCGLPEQGAVHHADIRALEARVKELEAALREAKRAMDSYAPKGEPSLRGRYDTRAQAMVDAALRGKP